MPLHRIQVHLDDEENEMLNRVAKSKGRRPRANALRKGLRILNALSDESLGKREFFMRDADGKEYRVFII